MEEVPIGLRDADGGLARVRAAWVQHGATLCRALAPLVVDIASLSPGRVLKGALWERVGPEWNDAVRVPAAGFPTFRRSAEAWAAARGSEWPASVPPQGNEERT